MPDLTGGDWTVLGLRISRDSEFLDTVRALMARAAEYLGFAAGDSEGISAAVDRAVGALVHHPGGEAASIEIEVAVVGGDMRISLTYDGAQAPVTALRQSMEPASGAGGMVRVEFGNDDTRAFCRLVRRLPEPRV
jgi:hypothetical protein